MLRYGSHDARTAEKQNAMRDDGGEATKSPRHLDGAKVGEPELHPLAEPVRPRHPALASPAGRTRVLAP